jgi:uncharacterized protein (TIGR02284 family)
MSGGSHPSGGSEAHKDEPAGSARSSAPERAADVAAAALETTRGAATQASEMARDVARQGYDIGRRALQSGGIFDNPVATMLVGAAVGYAAAYAVHARSTPNWDWRVGPDRRRSSDVITTLNGLVEISKDGEQGFRACADGVKDGELKAFFERAAQRCADGARELQRHVRAFGGEPEEGGTWSGSAHRAWVNVKSTITGLDDLAILNECERGEDVAKAAYASALKAHLPPHVRSVVERQYKGVRQNHDRVRELRNRYRAAV